MKKLWLNLSSTDIRNILAVLYVSMVLCYIYVLAFVPVPERNKDLVNVIGGNVIGGLGIVLGYYFGSSKQSGNKSENSQ